VPEPWNNWYHCNGNTYGTWVPGDVRGWRARHHREHCEGDNKNPPPPGTYDALAKYSRNLMTRPEVHLSIKARTRARDAMVEALHFHHIELVALCVDDHHFHLLARFPNHDPRKWVGIAKKESARTLSSENIVEEGGIWAVRCRCLPINDRDHQLNVARYIRNHKSQGAAVWLLSKVSPQPTARWH